jgi:hypothetical protein
MVGKWIVASVIALGLKKKTIDFVQVGPSSNNFIQSHQGTAQKKSEVHEISPIPPSFHHLSHGFLTFYHLE